MAGKSTRTKSKSSSLNEKKKKNGDQGFVGGVSGKNKKINTREKKKNEMMMGMGMGMGLGSSTSKVEDAMNCMGDHEPYLFSSSCSNGEEKLGMNGATCLNPWEENVDEWPLHQDCWSSNIVDEQMLWASSIWHPVWDRDGEQQLVLLINEVVWEDDDLWHQ